MVSGDTAASKVISGAIESERVTLSVTPTGTDYQWALVAPLASSTARSALSSTTAAAPTFTPDVGGVYVLTCIVDSVTSYTLRATVLPVTIAQLASAIRVSPVTDVTIPTPGAGVTLFYSEDAGGLATKNSDGDVAVVGGVSSLPSGSAIGQVLRWTGSVGEYGAVNLADSDALTGKLPHASLADGVDAGDTLVWSGSAWELGAGSSSSGPVIADASVSITVAQGNHRRVLAGTLTANRTITLSTSGAEAGDLITIYFRDNGAFDMAIVNGGPAVGTAYTFVGSADVNASFRFDGIDWVLWTKESV